MAEIHLIAEVPTGCANISAGIARKSFRFATL